MGEIFKNLIAGEWVGTAGNENINPSNTKDVIGVFAQAGALPGHVLEDLISQIRALDMDEVRAKIAEAEAAEPSAT